MLKRDFNSRFLCGCLVLATLAPWAPAEPSLARIRISSTQVASALESAGWKITASQVRLLSEVTSERTDPNLEVMQVSKWREDKIKAKLRCRDRHACLPFFVLVDGVEAGQAGSDTSRGVQKLAFDTAALPPLMRGGDHATMVFADKMLRISVPVICLQSGRRGQTIRVSSEDHKRFFRAEVVASGLLRATSL